MIKTATRPKQKPNCCGVIAEAKYRAREKKENRTKSQPWIVLKLAIGITLGLLGYTCYVYIGRLTIPMIRRDDNALGSRALGSKYHSVIKLVGALSLMGVSRVRCGIFFAPTHDTLGIRESVYVLYTPRTYF